MKCIIKEEGQAVGPTAALKVDSHHTARHDTTRQKSACIHIYRQLTEMIAESLVLELNNKQTVFELKLFLTLFFHMKWLNNFHLRI